jgi:GNAT superfamily N-acetyltransferase
MSYDLRAFTHTDEELGRAAALLAEVFPKAGFTASFLRWQYLENPDGVAQGFNAWDGHGNLAGHYATIPVRAKLFGAERSGLLSLNTATHPLHSGKGLFTALALDTYDAARSNGHQFVVGVANAASTHGFVSKLGFQLVGPLQAKIGVGTPVLGSALTQVVDFERIWSRERLSWRIANPNGNYATFEEYGKQVLTSRTGYPCVSAVLGEFATDLLHSDRLHHQKPWVRLYLGMYPEVNWQRLAYLDIPLRWRPSPLHLIFLDLTGQGRTLDAAKVHFRCADFDAY